MLGVIRPPLDFPIGTSVLSGGQHFLQRQTKRMPCKRPNHLSLLHTQAMSLSCLPAGSSFCFASYVRKTSITLYGGLSGSSGQNPWNLIVLPAMPLSFKLATIAHSIQRSEYTLSTECPRSYTISWATVEWYI